jgi:hypothetical protein
MSLRARRARESTENKSMAKQSCPNPKRIAQADDDAANLVLAQRVRQFRDIRRNLPRFIAREQAWRQTRAGRIA